MKKKKKRQEINRCLPWNNYGWQRDLNPSTIQNTLLRYNYHLLPIISIKSFGNCISTTASLSLDIHDHSSWIYPIMNDHLQRKKIMFTVVFYSLRSSHDVNRTFGIIYSAVRYDRNTARTKRARNVINRPYLSTAASPSEQPSERKFHPFLSVLLFVGADRAFLLLLFSIHGAAAWTSHTSEWRCIFFFPIKASCLVWVWQVLLFISTQAATTKTLTKMPIKVYGSTMSTCTRKVLTTLHEKGLKYELVNVDLLKGEQKVK